MSLDAEDEELLRKYDQIQDGAGHFSSEFMEELTQTSKLTDPIKTVEVPFLLFFL